MSWFKLWLCFWGHSVLTTWPKPAPPPPPQHIHSTESYAKIQMLGVTKTRLWQTKMLVCVREHLDRRCAISQSKVTHTHTHTHTHTYTHTHTHAHTHSNSMVSQIGRHSQWLMVRVVNNWHKESKGRRGRAREDVIYTSHPIIIIPKLPEVFIRKAYWIIIDMHIYVMINTLQKNSWTQSTAWLLVSDWTFSKRR